MLVFLLEAFPITVHLDAIYLCTLYDFSVVSILNFMPS